MATDVLRPPANVAAREIRKAAALMERLKLRRRVLLSKLKTLEGELRTARRVFEALVADVSAIPGPTLEDIFEEGRDGQHDPATS